MRTIDANNLNLVAAFVQVAETQSFRRAAVGLGISKSTLSQRVAALEERLGAQLLWRTTRQVRLTDIGETYYQAVAPALAEISSADRMVGDVRGTPRGHLRITVPVEMGQCLLGAVLSDFTRRYPEVEVSADLSDRRVDLVKEGYDLAVRVGPLTDSTLIQKRLVTFGPLRLFASPAYLAEHGTPRTPRDLADHALIAMTNTQETSTWRLEGPDGPVTIPIRPRISVGSWGVVRELAAQDLGIARLPEMTGHHGQDDAPLTEVLPEWAPPGSDCFAVYPGGRNPSAAQRAMIEVLDDHLAATVRKCVAMSKGRVGKN